MYIFENLWSSASWCMCEDGAKIVFAVIIPLLYWSCNDPFIVGSYVGLLPGYTTHKNKYTHNTHIQLQYTAFLASTKLYRIILCQTQTLDFLPYLLQYRAVTLLKNFEVMFSIFIFRLEILGLQNLFCVFTSTGDK